jgi:hypothetical protein
MIIVGLRAMLVGKVYFGCEGAAFRNPEPASQKF